MLAVRPYAFDAEFRDEAAARSAAELEAEIERLRRRVEEAWEEGRVAGAAEALATLEAERATALLAATGAVAAGLVTLDHRWVETEQAVARLGAELALDLTDHLAARALERDPAAAIDLAIGRALTQVRRGEPILIRVAPDLAPAIQTLVDERLANERRRLFLTVVEDASVPRGDARFEWNDGCLLLDREARRAAISEEIAALLAA